MDTIRDQFENVEIIHDYDWQSRHKEFYDKIPSGKEWHWLRSDVIRYEYLSENEDILYLDWDTRINWLPELNNLMWSYDQDNWVIYNNKNTAAFKYMLDEAIKKSKTQSTITRGWIIQFIHDVGGDVFPKNSVEHLGYRVWPYRRNTWEK